MDRQLLLFSVVTALILVGCSGDKSPPPAEAVTYQQKTTYDFSTDEVSGNLLRPDGKYLEESPVPTIPEIEAIPDRFARIQVDGGSASNNPTAEQIETAKANGRTLDQQIRMDAILGAQKAPVQAGAGESPVPTTAAVTEGLESVRGPGFGEWPGGASGVAPRASGGFSGLGGGGGGSGFSTSGLGAEPYSGAALDSSRPYSGSAPTGAEFAEFKRQMEQARQRALAEESRRQAELEAQLRAQEGALLGGLTSRPPSETSQEPRLPSGSAPASASSTEAEHQNEIAPGSGLSAESRKKILAKMEEQSPTVLGVLGTQKRDGSEQPNLATELSANSLRGAASGAAPPQPAAANPLRAARIAPQAAALSPTAGPSGGALPPPGGLAEIERAFSAATPPSPGSAASESRQTPATGSAAPETSPPAAGESGGSATFSSVADGLADASPAPAPPDDSPFHVVEVFYGTDRQSAEALAFSWTQLLAGFLPTATVALIALCVGLLATGRRSWMLWLVAAGGLAVSLSLAYRASAAALALVRNAGKEGPRYTTQRSTDGRVELGRCEITIPKTHESGEIEAPSILRLEVVEDAADHVILQKTERLADTRFHELLRQRVEHSARRELFVFVHGFNVSFADAARRTAQIHHDLKFDGAPIFFSWPAHDKFILTYPADETNVAWSVPHLKQFLLSIVKESQAKSINLVAHSMGNRALAAALREIELEMHDQAKLFNQVILAAPDIDADDFRNNIAPAMQRTAQRLTLYASAHDEALLASQFLHRGARAGAAGEGLIVVPGVDTIDVTAIETSLWGHSYYGSSHPVLQDLRMLLSRAIPPRDRTWLSPAERDGLTYWIFQPVRTAAAESGLSR